MLGDEVLTSMPRSGISLRRFYIITLAVVQPAFYDSELDQIIFGFCDHLKEYLSVTTWKRGFSDVFCNKYI